MELIELFKSKVRIEWARLNGIEFIKRFLELKLLMFGLRDNNLLQIINLYYLILLLRIKKLNN